MDVKLSDEAYDVGGAEALPAAVATGEAESSSVEGERAMPRQRGYSPLSDVIVCSDACFAVSWGRGIDTS